MAVILYNYVNKILKNKTSFSFKWILHSLIARTGAAIFFVAKLVSSLNFFVFIYRLDHFSSESWNLLSNFLVISSVNSSGLILLCECFTHVVSPPTLLCFSTFAIHRHSSDMRFRAHCSHFLPSVAQLPPVQYFL